MEHDLVDRLVSRIAQETRLARAASHPRARIAHHMLAEAYRGLVSRMMRIGIEDTRRAGAPLPRKTDPAEAAPPTGFLADRLA